ncbi:MAG TPA: hypothetical protein DER23_00125 [Clostridiales bacterium]|nr:hypothetical protein [Clostridiales bacterium]
MATHSQPSQRPFSFSEKFPVAEVCIIFCYRPKHIQKLRKYKRKGVEADMQNSEIKKGAGYFDELALRFRREHIDCAASEDDRLPVLLDGREVGIVTPGGGIRVRKESIDDPIANELYHRAGAIAAEVHEYMELMKNAPPLKAVSLSDPYKLLAEFNGYVFGGMESKYGVQFTTWEWTYNKTGLTHGHYCCNDYAAAKQDFALRAGLVDKTLIFPDEMLVEMYRCAGQVLDGQGSEIRTYEEDKLLEQVRERIGDILPDVDIKADQQQNFEQTM